MARYLLDSNTFIQSKNNIPMDIFPSFWVKLGTLMESGVVVLHESVFNELLRHEDELIPWIKGLDGVKPLKTSEKAFEKYLELCIWTKSQNYSRQAVEAFTDQNRADAWLCAEAAVSDLIIVTNEKRQRSLNKIKIPDICDIFGITCIGWADFMREEGFRF